MSPITFHCPKCSRDSRGEPGRAMPCDGCGLLLIDSGEGTQEARRFGERPSSPESTSVVPVCRTCGCPLPPHVMQKPLGGVRCLRCGAWAWQPDIISMLRVAARRPAMLRPPVRRFMLAWAAVFVVFLATSAYHFLREPGGLREEQSIVLSSGAEPEEIDGVRHYGFNARMPSITVTPRGNTFISATVWADDLSDAHLRLRVAAVQEAGRGEHEMEVSLWRGSVPGGQTFSPRNHAYAELPLGKGLASANWPPGRYHLVVKKAMLRGEELPSALRVTWTSWSSPGHGWWLLGGNIIFWSFLFALVKMVRDPLAYRRSLSLPLILALLAACFMLLIEIHPLPGTYESGHFERQSISNT